MLHSQIKVMCLNFRFGTSILVRSRDCSRTVESASSDLCPQCLLIPSYPPVKRELVESWPDIPGNFDCDREETVGMTSQDEVKQVEVKDEKKKRGRKQRKTEEESDEDENWNNDNDWNDDDNWNKLPKQKRLDKSLALFPCPEPDCGENFSKEERLVSHLLKSHPGKHSKVAEGWAKCTEEGCFHCYKEGVPHYTKHLINHLKKFHPDNPLLLAETGQKNDCSYCGKTFKYNYSLKKHLETLHEAPIVPCHICGILLKGQKTLSTHLKSVHDKAVRHHCPEPGCTMTAVNSHHLKDHIAVVHRGQAR